MAQPTVLKSTPNDSFSRLFSLQFYFFHRIFARNLLRKEVAEEIFFHIFFFLTDLGLRLLSLHTTNKTTTSNTSAFIIQKALQMLTDIILHNQSLQPFCQDYDLVSHTIYVVCVNFI